MKNPHEMPASVQNEAPAKKSPGGVPSCLDPQVLLVMREEFRMAAKEVLTDTIREDLRSLVREEVVPVQAAVQEVKADMAQFKAVHSEEIASIKTSQQELADKFQALKSAPLSAPPHSQNPDAPSTTTATAAATDAQQRSARPLDQGPFVSYVHVKGWAPYNDPNKTFLSQEECLNLYQKLRADMPDHVKTLWRGVIANRLENYELRIKAADRDTCFTIKDAVNQILVKHGDRFLIKGRVLKCNVAPTPGKKLRDQQFAGRLASIHKFVPHAKIHEQGPVEVLPCWASGKIYLQRRGDTDTQVLAGTPTRGGAWVWEMDRITSLCLISTVMACLQSREGARLPPRPCMPILFHGMSINCPFCPWLLLSPALLPTSACGVLLPSRSRAN